MPFILLKNFSNMKTLILIICILFSLNLYSQSLTLTDLERFDTLSSHSARVSFITNKGFSFLGNESYINDSGAIEHRIVYIKGIFTAHDSSYNKETIQWISEMTTKAFSYKTPDAAIYNTIIRQIRPKYPSGVETTDSKGDTFVKYMRNNKNITGVLNKKVNEDGTSTVLYNLQFSSN
jgi:hypothetical protein